MAKFKPARGKKSRRGPVPQGGLPCVIVVIAGMLLIMLFLYFVMTHAS